MNDLQNTDEICFGQNIGSRLTEGFAGPRDERIDLLVGVVVGVVLVVVVVVVYGGGCGCDGMER